MSEPKQVIVMRKDLNMRKGKMVAQGAHASMAVILDQTNLRNAIRYGYRVSQEIDSPIEKWLSGKFTKICLSVDSEEELLALYNKAKEKNISCSLITDSGATEFNGVPTNTCIAIGPDYPEVIDTITGHLRLL